MIASEGELIQWLQSVFNYRAIKPRTSMAAPLGFQEGFERTLIVPALADRVTQDLGASGPGFELFITDAFYRNGARFNKGASAEEGFDVLGRDGWILVWDADIVLPADMSIDESQRDPEKL